MAVLATLFISPHTAAQTAQELLDKSMKLQIDQEAFSGTALTRRITGILIRKEGQEIGASRYDIATQSYRHVDVTTRPPDDWVVKLDHGAISEQSFGGNGSQCQVLIKRGGNSRFGTFNSDGLKLNWNDWPPEVSTRTLQQMVTDSSPNISIPNDIVYQYLPLQARGLGNRGWGLQTPAIKRVETSPDGTKVYCIWAKRGNGQAVLIWIDGSSFRVTRVIRFPEASIPYGNLENGFVTTALDYSETVYTYETAPFPSDDELAGFRKPPIDFTLPEIRTRFLNVEDVNDLSSDQCKLPPFDPNRPPEPNDNKLWSVDLKRSLVVIETDQGTASGFIARFKGIDFVVTNLHLIGPGKKITLKTMTGTALPYTAIYGAIGRDIALLRIPTNGGALRLATDVTKATKKGQSVVSVGNQEGLGIAYENQNSGKVFHLWADRIEVDGVRYEDTRSSGRPIISKASGEVLGVAAYTTSETVDINEWIQSNQTVRLFGSQPVWLGFRLDGDIQWQPIELARWQNQRKQIDALRNLSDALVSVLKGRFQDVKEQPRLLTIVEGFRTKTARLDQKSPAYADEMKTFVKNLRTLAEENARQLESADLYDYYRSCLHWDENASDQLEYRAAIIRVLNSHEENPLPLAARLGKR